MKSKKKGQLREGFSTGACAAAAAMAASICIKEKGLRVSEVHLPFPDGIKRTIKVCWVKSLSSHQAQACVIKDAGDDPDVTDGAAIITTVEILPQTTKSNIEIIGGTGVGRVTKPGLAVEPGEPAINPVPRQMITNAILDVFGNTKRGIRATVSVPDGEQLAKKTLNSRLGIVGGISILGTTGIVKPISEAAWCATITVSMDVALAVGLDTICLSTGRSSEEAAMKDLSLREEAFISMGDYVGFALKEAAKRPFKKVILACQWSKLVKMAMGWNQTHVRFGPLEPKAAIDFLKKEFGFSLKEHEEINTVRQLLLRLQKRNDNGLFVIKGVCRHAYKRLRDFLPPHQELNLILVSYEKNIIHKEG